MLTSKDAKFNYLFAYLSQEDADFRRLLDRLNGCPVIAIDPQDVKALDISSLVQSLEVLPECYWRLSPWKMAHV